MDLRREVVTFDGSEINFIGNILRNAYGIIGEAEALNDTGDLDSKLFLGDFISALDSCDCIEITR